MGTGEPRDTELLYWLALFYDERAGISRRRLKEITLHWTGGGLALSELAQTHPADLRGLVARDDREAVALLDALKKAPSHHKTLDRIRAGGVGLITRADPLYPAALARSLPEEMHPFLLFYRGNPGLTARPSLAVTGSRGAGDAALEWTRDVCVQAASSGIAIVSGYGQGVGQAAISAAISIDISVEEGCGIIILPLGIGHFEAELRRMGAGALDEGRLLVLSPYPIDAPWDERAAVARNRLVTGIATATLVVAAAEGGNTHREAARSIEEGRPVLVWDAGPEDDPAAILNRELLEAGAFAVRDADGVLAAFLDFADEGQPLREGERLEEEEPLFDTPFDAGDAIETLSRGGRLPEKLLRRLRGEEDDEGDG